MIWISRILQDAVDRWATIYTASLGLMVDESARLNPGPHIIPLKPTSMTTAGRQCLGHWALSCTI
jgi:hypothetical protein